MAVKEEMKDEQIGSHSVHAVHAVRPAKVERVHAAAAAAVPPGSAAPVVTTAVDTAHIKAIIAVAESYRGADACPAAAVEAPLVPIQPAQPPAHVVVAHNAASVAPVGRPASATVNINWDEVVYYNDPLRGKVLNMKHAPIASPYARYFLVSRCRDVMSTSHAYSTILSRETTVAYADIAHLGQSAKLGSSAASSSSSGWSNWSSWDSWDDSRASSSWWNNEQPSKFGDCPWNLPKG
jgi:hypothetical protein